MGQWDIYPEFEVVRNDSRCTKCLACVAQCANGVHRYDEKLQRLACDDTKCVDCHRCVAMCPTRALKIEKSGCALRENGNWDGDTLKAAGCSLAAWATQSPTRSIGISCSSTPAR